MSLIATAFGTKVAIAALSLVAIGGGTAVAAVAASGGLPHAVGAPTSSPTATEAPDGSETASAPSPEPTDTALPVGPDATGPAAFGLCTAYTAGGLASTSVAYASLLSASQSAGTIADYCAPILSSHARAAGHGRPTSAPTPPVTSPNSNATDHGSSGSTGHGAANSHAH